MPLYEYQCDACGHRFETIQKFSDAPVTVCPRCGGAVRKLVSSPAFQFKGSGWYATDYAKKSDSSKADSKSESTGSKDASKDSKDSSTKETAPTDSTSKDSSSTKKTS